MFTGIIETVGEITRAAGKGSSTTIEISCAGDFSVAVSDSVSVDGVCLTVVEAKNGGKIFALDVSHETLSRTTLGSKRPGDKVNLERALKAGGRFGGHIVTGHIDGTGVVSSVIKRGDFTDVTIKTGAEILKYVAKKGSIAVDGVSLTINGKSGDCFDVTIIPYTLKNSTFSRIKKGCALNLEVDLIARYVYEFSKNAGGSSEIDSEFLKRYGFK